MHSYSTNILLNLPELNICLIHEETDAFLLNVEPVTRTQPCPCCGSEHVIRRGVAYTRKVRHLPAFGRPVYLCLPAIRMTCKGCHASFVWQYACVAPGKRYTKAFESALPSQVVGATVTRAARQMDTPSTTVERVYKKWLKEESARIQAECLAGAQTNQRLVLGIDDFAIRKGHTYNTGLHDLRGNALLDVIPGRTTEELHTYYRNNPVLGTLKPVAVVMDLARCYHTFIKEVYPNAVRIADRFHVNRYVTEALQTVRKEVQHTLSPRARKQLKQQFRVLGKRQDDLTDKEQMVLTELLRYSNLLRTVYKWKEAFIEWYDCSSTLALAEQGFDRWLVQGEHIDHVAVRSCLKTMKNWRQEICNYHHLRFTNAAVEGRNNKIKALQRRHYFTRNPLGYKQRVLLECNEERIQY